MKYSYFPGCTLKNKAVDLDHYARISAEALASSWRRSASGSAAAAYIRWALMRSPRSWLLSVPSTMRKSTARIW